jgi:hypothetical protein
MGLVLDTVVVSHAIVGISCEESGRRVNMGLLQLARAHCFTSVVTPQSYKVGGLPCASLRPLAQAPIASSPPFICLKRERERDKGNFWGLESVAS